MSSILQLFGRLRLQVQRKHHVVGWNMTPEEVIAFFKRLGKTTLTFYGYSGMGYEDEKGMLQIAKRVLSNYSPKTTLINSGGTSTGIGAVYPLVKSMKFETAGIVTTQALQYPGEISDFVDHICFVTDTQYGGRLAGSAELSPTSRAMVECSDILVGIGGGDITKEEMLEGKARGKPVHYYPAEMNHERAIRLARERGVPSPESFLGSVHDVFGNG